MQGNQNDDQNDQSNHIITADAATTPADAAQEDPTQAGAADIARPDGTRTPLPHGLTGAEAARRLEQDGPNEVPQPKFSFAKAFFKGLWNLSAWILEGALLLEFVLGKVPQALLVLFMLLFAAANGAVQKRRSNRVLADISHDLTPVVAVERDGKWTKVDSKNLVVGDLVWLRRGDVLAADARLVSGGLSCDESSVTGESQPIRKKIGDTAYSGTTVAEGSGLAVVTATGRNSRSGKTVNLINKSAAPGHLQVLLTRIIYYLCLLDTALTAVLVVAMAIRGEGWNGIVAQLPFFAMMFIASIPVAMPSTFAVSNSFEAKRLSAKGVLTSDLTGIQDAANIDVLLLDKTGTITQNATSVSSWTDMSDMGATDTGAATPDADGETGATGATGRSRTLALSASAADRRNQSVIDTAILGYAAKMGVDVPQPDEFTPFSPQTGYSRALTRGHEVLLGSLKVLAGKDPQAQEKLDRTHVDLTLGRSVAVLIDGRLAGVFLTQDTIREDSPDALRQLRRRGITTIMLTGDNRRTAQAVATKVGLEGGIVSRADLDLAHTDITASAICGIADVLPEGKLEIVKALQEQGHIVGMTGDGVNDAPALKQAEVGIAMSNAADVAKRSGKMVLLTDGLSPILEILDAGQRVHHRMITWAISKLSRTAELTMLITFAYLLFRELPIDLNAMVIFTIMNNLVTLMLGTDNAKVSDYPQKWDIGHLSRISFALAGAWMALGLGLFAVLQAHGHTLASIQVMLFVYMELTAIAIMLTARTDGYFWRSAPSRPVWGTQLAEVVLTSVLVLTGWAMGTAISWIDLLLVAAVVIAGAVVIDLIYVPIHRYVEEKRERARRTEAGLD